MVKNKYIYIIILIIIYSTQVSGGEKKYNEGLYAIKECVKAYENSYDAGELVGEAERAYVSFFEDYIQVDLVKGYYEEIKENTVKYELLVSCGFEKTKEELFLYYISNKNGEVLYAIFWGVDDYINNNIYNDNNIIKIKKIKIEKKKWNKN